jgi:hypothetical protein
LLRIITVENYSKKGLDENWGAIKLSSFTLRVNLYKIMALITEQSQESDMPEVQSDEKLRAMEELLLSNLPSNGAALGNVSLLTILKRKGWSEETFWAIRNRLVDQGILEKGRGKGGSTKRIVLNIAPEPEAGTTTEEVIPESVSTPAETHRIDESTLYEPMAEVIKNKWALNSGFNNSIVEITAKQGRRDTGGKWSRPDITLASMTTYPYVPGRYLDVITFEVKPFDLIDLTAVYEALAHKRAAHRSYVILYVPEERLKALEDDVQAIADEATRHGIGLIVAAKADKFETWDERVIASRKEPDPKLLNNFLARQLSQIFRETMALWFR